LSPFAIVDNACSITTDHVWGIISGTHPGKYRGSAIGEMKQQMERQQIAGCGKEERRRQKAASLCIF